MRLLKGPDPHACCWSQSSSTECLSFAFEPPSCAQTILDPDDGPLNRDHRVAFGGLDLGVLASEVACNSDISEVKSEGRGRDLVLTWRRVVAYGEDGIHAATAGAASSLSQIGLSSRWVAVQFHFAGRVAVVRVASNLGG